MLVACPVQSFRGTPVYLRSSDQEFSETLRVITASASSPMGPSMKRIWVQPMVLGFCLAQKGAYNHV